MPPYPRGVPPLVHRAGSDLDPARRTGGACRDGADAIRWIPGTLSAIVCGHEGSTVDVP